MQERAYSIQAGDVHAVCVGEPNLTPIICLHGWLDNAASFTDIWQAFPEYYLIAVDLPGHGKSFHRSLGAEYNLIDYVQDVRELIVTNKWHNVRFIGHSLGGIIASMYAALFPEDVESLVIIESFGPLTMPVSSTVEQLRNSIETRLNAKQKIIKQPKSLSSVVKARTAQSDLNTHEAEMIMSRNLRQNADGEWQWRTDHRLRTLSNLRMTEQQAEQVMSNIKCPTMLILGTEGFEKLKVNVEKRAHLIKHLRIEYCDGGHHVHMRSPRQICDKIRDFLLN